MLLHNHVALITGGSGGIGRATARLFLEHGARVVLADLDADALTEAAAALGADDDRLRTVTADVTASDDNRRMVETTVDAFGPITFFFANAGIEGDVAPIVDYAEDTFDAVIGVNVKGTWLGLKHALPAMKDGGSVAITSSVAGLEGSPAMSAYVTSKHAVVGLMRVAAKEVAARGIRVNTINPGPVDNRMMRSLEAGMGEGAQAQLEAQIPLGRYADEADVANAALYFASDLSRYVTGTVHPVDGGLTA